MAYSLAMDSVLRFLHILSGIVWIGHLYFFNLTNLPVFKFAIANGNPDQKGGPSLVLRAMWWFRWGAMATLVFGLWLFHVRAQASGLGDMAFLTDTLEGNYIAIGMLLGIVMWVNVWFIIWPAQKVVLGNNLQIAKGVPDDQKAKLEAQNKPLAARAKMASRTNFWLSIPMLLFMVAASHNWFFFS
ncbi:MAG: hypothetical protein QOG31_1111 [Thermoplasmata archaeon]|nr:hypothetical protein [Thermoplasmata archaeon]